MTDGPAALSGPGTKLQIALRCAMSAGDGWQIVGFFRELVEPRGGFRAAERELY